MNDINRYPYKQVISLGLVLALVLALTAAPPMARAEQTGEVTGIFNVATAPEITSISVKPHGEGDEATSLTPMQKYDITVEVSSSNTIDDLSMLKVALWYDEDGNDYGEAKFDEVSAKFIFGDSLTWISGANAQKDVTIIWDRDNSLECVHEEREDNKTFINWYQPHGWEFIGDYNVPEEDDENVIDENESFTFEFTLKISKVALKTYENAKWRVAAKLTDCSGLDHYLPYSQGEESIYGFQMNWYGEQVMTDNHKVDWGIISAGINFEHEDAVQHVFNTQQGGAGLLRYFSNGYYGTQVKADTTWTNNNGGEATRTEDADDENTFALRVQQGGAVEYNEENVKSLPVSEGEEEDEAFEEMSSGLLATTTGGHTPPYYMYIKLNESFPSATYSGNITFGIFNASPAD